MAMDRCWERPDPEPSALLRFIQKRPCRRVYYMASQMTCLDVPRHGGTLWLGDVEQARGSHVHVEPGTVVLWIEHVNDVPF